MPNLHFTGKSIVKSNAVVMVAIYSRYNSVLYFSFPSNLTRRKIWFSLLCFDLRKRLHKQSEICSEHFDKSDFQYDRNGFKYLKLEANPKPLHPEIFPPQSLR